MVSSEIACLAKRSILCVDHSSEKLNRTFKRIKESKMDMDKRKKFMQIAFKFNNITQVIWTELSEKIYNIINKELGIDIKFLFV
jgi:hypothetical protein